jgi:hypothetical protein
VQLSAEVVASLAASFTSTLLQHYNLWAYVSTHEQQHVQHQHHLMVRHMRHQGVSIRHAD